MKHILLTNSSELALVDDEDFPRVSARLWSMQSHGYIRTWEGKKSIYLHRFVMNAREGEEIDHKDLNKLNCQKNNLRRCTRSQNNVNRARDRDNTSGFKGVNWDKDRGKFLARIGINGKGKNLGRFDTAIEAARAYNAAALKHFGEFAHLNEIPGEN